MPIEGLRSKSWNEFGKPDAPRSTLCLQYATGRLGAVPRLAGSTIDSAVERSDPATAKGTEEQIQRAYFEA